MGGFLITPVPGEGTGKEGPAGEWRSLCERFHDIRQGAYRHNLEEAWQELVKADPAGPGILVQWRALDERIQQCDEDELLGAVRSGADGRDIDSHDDEANIDDWDGWGDEYGCPVVLCDRKARSFLGNLPRCELFNSPMAM